MSWIGKFDVTFFALLLFFSHGQLLSSYIFWVELKKTLLLHEIQHYFLWSEELHNKRFYKIIYSRVNFLGILWWLIPIEVKNDDNKSAKFDNLSGCSELHTAYLHLPLQKALVVECYSKFIYWTIIMKKVCQGGSPENCKKYFLSKILCRW